MSFVFWVENKIIINSLSPGQKKEYQVDEDRDEERHFPLWKSLNGNVFNLSGGAKGSPIDRSEAETANQTFDRVFGRVNIARIVDLMK